VHRDPCCWKWHSSSNHKSRSVLFARRHSFFISPLGFRISLRDHRSRLSPPKVEVMKKPSALPNSDVHPIVGSQMVAEQFSIPQILRIPQFRGEKSRSFPKAALVFSTSEARRQGARPLQGRQNRCAQSDGPNIGPCVGYGQRDPPLGHNSSPNRQEESRAADDRSVIPRIARFRPAQPII
jgi:hypothetical protein